MAKIPALIDLQGIEKRFDRPSGAPVAALRNISLQIYAGEFICITGSSGSGKSTLLNILGCLTRPSRGTYRFAGRDVHDLDSDMHADLRCHAFGFVFQNYNLLESATARQNVEMPGVFAGMALTRRRARALRLLAALGLEERADHRPAALSGGEQQRVAIARSLMNGGRVILADEPTGALDRENARQVLHRLEELARRGHTVALVSHSSEVAGRADRVIELRDGRIAADSGPTPIAEGLRRPTSRVGPESGLLGTALRWVERLRSALLAISIGLWAARRVRTVLTILSIIIGVWTVGTMLSIAEGVYQQTLERVGRLGADRIQVVPADRSTDPAVVLTLDDARAIAQTVPNVRRVAPALTENKTVSHGAKNTRTRVESYSDFFPPDGIGSEIPRVKRGRFITPADNRFRNQVAVIGWLVEEALFPADVEAVGQYVMIGQVPFRVTGVLAPHDEIADAPRWFAGNPGQQVVIPFETGIALLKGATAPRSLDVFVIDPLEAASTERAIRRLLIRRHGSEGFSLSYLGDRVEQVGEIRGLLWLSLAAVGSIALLAGGIGVAAIMLMAVSERTREIGIRMALGAHRRDITQQFVLEAMVLAGIGGLLGLVTSVSTAPLVRSFGLPAAFSLSIALIALAGAMVTGLIAGIAPARRASGIEPATAIAADG